MTIPPPPSPLIRTLHNTPLYIDKNCSTQFVQLIIAFNRAHPNNYKSLQTTLFLPPNTRFYPIISFSGTKAENEAAPSSGFARSPPTHSLSLFSDMFLSAEHAKAKRALNKCMKKINGPTNQPSKRHQKQKRKKPKSREEEARAQQLQSMSVLLYKPL
jgi:hypothetical protein